MTETEGLRPEAPGGGYTEAAEIYPAESEATLAQCLTDEGLLGAINAALLHPLGLALGVQGKKTSEPGAAPQVEVRALTLHHTDDPEGFRYDADALGRVRAKLTEHHPALLPLLP